MGDRNGIPLICYENLSKRIQNLEAEPETLKPQEGTLGLGMDSDFLNRKLELTDGIVLCENSKGSS